MPRSDQNLRGLIQLIQAEIGRHYGPPSGDESAQAAFAGRLQEILTGAGYGDAKPESKQVTILLTDIRGFTALAETYSAIKVVEMLNRYFARMCEVVVDYRGTIDKFMGDSIMVLFGAPNDRSDDLERAIACAVEMQLAMEGINEQNRIRGLPDIFMGIGINTGAVVAGPLGSDLHTEYTVIGDEVNLTSRIEAHSLRGQVLISENTYRLARDFIEVGEPNRVQVKGKAKPVTLYELRATRKPKELIVPNREVRKSPRVEVNMPLEFQRVEGKKILEERLHGEVLDMSYSGMMIKVPNALEPLTEIKLSLSLGLLDPSTSAAYAKVLRSEEQNGAHICHLEFTSLDPSGQQAIKDFVDQMVYPG